MPIASPEGRDEHRHVSIPFQSAETFHGFEDPSRDPPQHHLTTAPPLDVALHVTRAAEQTLRGVGGGQGPAKSRGEFQREHRERFVESFTHALGGTGILGLEPAREVEQQPLCQLRIGGLVGTPQDRLRPRAVAIAQVLQNVPHLVDLAALHERRIAEGGAHGFAQRLGAIEDHKQTAVRAQPATLEIREQALAHGGVLGRSVPQPQCMLVPVGRNPECHMRQ